MRSHKRIFSNQIHKYIDATEVKGITAKQNNSSENNSQFLQNSNEYEIHRIVSINTDNNSVIHSTTHTYRNIFLKRAPLSDSAS